jgi:NAD(P)-dependent dehydrogenase (short-subunit alcohol dehydrogenase family)
MEVGTVVTSEAKVAVITGASAGFGRLTFIALAERGYRVFGAFRGSRGGYTRESEKLTARTAWTSVRPETVQMDISDDRSVTVAIDEVLARAGRIDVLINCAAYGMFGPIECTTVEQARELYDTNVFGTMRVSQAVIPVMRGQGSGVILTFSSDVGVRANFFQGAYASSKFAVEGLIQVMRLELQQFGIKVALVNPGWYDTGFAESAVSTFRTGEGAPFYDGLVAAWNEGMKAVEGPNSNPGEVAEAVLRILEVDEPFFRNPVGWNPVRLAGVQSDDVDASQNRLFEYYQLGTFRGSWSAAPAPRPVR